MIVENLDQIIAWIREAVPEATLQIVLDDSPSGQRSVLVSPERAFEVAMFLREDPRLRFDYASNVTGIDWLDAVLQRKTRTKEMIEGVEREIERTEETRRPGYLEVVYHLYSMQLKHGPFILRLRTADRAKLTQLPSLTPVWRSAEFQEREVFDLFGVVFDGHPDLRRILMWDQFTDFPMRKDYEPPDDYEYEPTAHDEVLQRAKAYRVAQENA